MKYLIFSDIHGSATAISQMLEVFEREKCDYMIILGDILYHGPRNPLPIGHDPQKVVTDLNKYKDKIIAVGGNCDAQVDQMVLDFPCLSEYTLIVDEGIRIFATHGHNYTLETTHFIGKGDIFLYGHTHLWEIENRNGVTVCNPGSIALPKENRPPTYALYDKGYLTVYNLENQVLKTYHHLG